MTLDERCTVFSAGLDSLGGQDCTPFSPEIPRNAQNHLKKGGKNPYCTFFILYIYKFFSWHRLRAQKGVILTPKWEPRQNNMGFGGRTGFHKKIIDVQVGGRGGRVYTPWAVSK